MEEPRYEEHDYFNTKLPFTLFIDLQRSPDSYSKEANWHENIELEWYKEGSGVVLLDGAEQPIEKNDFIMVNSNVIHQTIPNSFLKYSCLIIDSDFCKNADIDYSIINFNSYIKSKELIGIFSRLEKAYNDAEIQLFFPFIPIRHINC